MRYTPDPTPIQSGPCRLDTYMSIYVSGLESGTRNAQWLQRTFSFHGSRKTPPGGHVVNCQEAARVGMCQGDDTTEIIEY